LQISLVSVRVKAYPALVTSQEVHFNQLHAGCGQRIRYEKHCPLHGKVDAGGIVSGYAYAPDQYVIIDEAELEQLRPAKDKGLVLEHFLDAGQLDPALYSGRTLYLLPEGPAAQQPYLLLSTAMQQHGKWAVGRVVLSGRRQIALVRPIERVLGLHLLHFPGQLRSSMLLESELRNGAASEAEQHLAGLLIAASSQPFAWSEYPDDTAEQLHRLVEAKVQGRPVETPAAEETPVLRLLDALQQSVARVQAQHPAAVAEASTGRGKGRRKPSRRSA
jgi:DNA end-binding protein Ku